MATNQVCFDHEWTNVPKWPVRYILGNFVDIGEKGNLFFTGAWWYEEVRTGDHFANTSERLMGEEHVNSEKGAQVVSSERFIYPFSLFNETV